MRGSTAAGINNFLLPRDCSCGDLPMVPCGEEAFPLAFGVFGIRLIRYRRGPPVVRNMRAVHENPLLWYARVVVCEYVIGYFRRTDNSLKLSATLSGDGIV